MLEREVTVMLESGLHARPAATFVHNCTKFASEIFLKKEQKIVNAKSILGVMSLAATKGSQIAIRAEGVDEEAAIEELAGFLSREEE